MKDDFDDDNNIIRNRNCSKYAWIILKDEFAYFILYYYSNE
jgi:hypothetical protein